MKADLQAQLNEKKFKLHYIPIVDNHKNRNLLFMVKTSELQTYCEEYLNMFH